MKGLVSLAIAYVLSQFYRSFLAVLTPQLSADIGADKADLSLASGIWFISFALMQFVVGVGLDRFGPRRTTAIIFGLGATSGALVFATAQTPTAIVVAMCLFGIGCSPVLMASLFIFARRFADSRFAIMTSSLVAFGTMGNVIGASPLAAAVDSYGWRQVMTALAVASFLVALAIYSLVRDPEAASVRNNGLAGYLTLLKSRALWAIMIMTLLCYAPVAGIRGLWAGPYLTDLYQANGPLIGTVTLYMAIAMIAGSLIYGPLDKLFKTRKWIIFTGNLIVLAVLLALAWNPLRGVDSATLLFIALGLCGSSYGVLMAHGRSFLPPHLVGRGVTLLNFCSIFGAGIMQFFTGQVMSWQTDPSSPASYQLLFATYALFLGAALAVYFFALDTNLRDKNQSAAQVTKPDTSR